MQLFTLHKKNRSTGSEVNSITDSGDHQPFDLGEIDAIERAFAVIRFQPDGTILDANANFLAALGYTIDQIRGKHHRIFVDPQEASCDTYKQFWKSLADGRQDTGVYCRLDNRGNEVWIQACYMPVLTKDGRVESVLKIATDITERKNQDSRRQGLLDAIDRSQAVIEFQPDGTIVKANDNFLKALGYQSDQVVGKHHRIFVFTEEQDSADYRNFWTTLASGKYFSKQFRRRRSDGTEIWIQASYNPVFDARGRVVSVVKYATDITEQAKMRSKMSDVGNVVACSTTQMTSTINEISRSVSKTALLASGTEEIAAKTNKIVAQLATSSSNIEKVVAAIQELADQTHLLALNARIESARAGEAGRGFSVVANEVKNLAAQTAAATKTIDQSIGEIQDQIAGVVGSTEEITSSAAEVNGNMTTLSSAIEEQSITMQSLSETAKQLSFA